jgi:hypothetical protein
MVSRFSDPIVSTVRLFIHGHSQETAQRVSLNPLVELTDVGNAFLPQCHNVVATNAPLLLAIFLDTILSVKPDIRNNYYLCVPYDSHNKQRLFP